MKTKTRVSTIEEYPRETRHRKAIALGARTVIQSINAHVDQDFFTLSTSQVEQLLEEADRVHYRQPKNANGSRARYFYAKLQREARRG